MIDARYLRIANGNASEEDRREVAAEDAVIRERKERASDRNLVHPETADRNREGRPGGYTFNAPIPEGYSGDAFTVETIRLGDHAHVTVSSGRHIPEPYGALSGRVRRGHAGRLVLRWHEWLILRGILAADERVHVAEVEQPTDGMIERYAG